MELGLPSLQMEGTEGIYGSHSRDHGQEYGLYYTPCTLLWPVLEVLDHYNGCCYIWLECVYYTVWSMEYMGPVHQ